jgi:methylglutaconyl-CoA hydratase
MTTIESLQTHVDERGVCTLTLHRPEQRNALDEPLVKALLQCFDEIQGDTGVRVVVLTGHGATFSGGGDLRWMRDRTESDEETNSPGAERLAELMHRLNTLNKPTVARVNGSAYGGGAGLVACCDIAVASREAAFAFTEVRLGLVPAVIAPYVIAAIGARQARRYFLSGEPFDADAAERIGLVHQVTDPERIDRAVQAHVECLLAGGPMTILECKRLVMRTVALDEDERIESARLLARLWTTPEAREGILSFLEKRQPAWRG